MPRPPATRPPRALLGSLVPLWAVTLGLAVAAGLLLAAADAAGAALVTKLEAGTLTRVDLLAQVGRLRPVLLAGVAALAGAAVATSLLVAWARGRPRRPEATAEPAPAAPGEAAADGPPPAPLDTVGAWRRGLVAANGDTLRRRSWPTPFRLPAPRDPAPSSAERRAVARSRDALTGLLARAPFEDVARRLLSERLDLPVAVVLGDLDGLAAINEAGGTEAGDAALTLLAHVLRASVRPQDVACRHGGDEFALLLPDCDEADGRAVLDRVRARLDAAVGTYAGPPFTASFGIAVHPYDGEDLAALVAAAGRALQRARADGGRGRVVGCSAIRRQSGSG